MIHAALDRLEEILGSPKHFDIVKMQRGTKWMGCLLPMEDCEIYGYVTASSVKILALLQRDSVIPLTKRKDVHIKALLVSFLSRFKGKKVLYCTYPFCPYSTPVARPTCMMPTSNTP